MSGRVMVVQNDGRFDLSEARRYGELVSIFDKRDLYPDNANDEIEAVMKTAYDALHAFDPEKDFLCLVGSPLYTAACCYVLGDMGKKPVRLLRFDKLLDGYYEVKLR